MLLNAINIITGAITIILVVAIISLSSTFLYAWFYRNKKINILNVNAIDESLKAEYGNKLVNILKNDALEELELAYPNVVTLFEKIIIGDSILYKSKYKEGKKLLFVINYVKQKSDNSFLNSLHVHGQGVRNGISEIFCLFEGLDKLIKKQDFTLDLSILLQNNINNDVLSYLDEKYDLVLNNNCEILDPITSKLRSFYAFIGVLNTGATSFRFTTERLSNGKSRLNEFIKIASKEFNKTYLSKPICNIMNNIGKDMVFSDRVIAINAWAFPTFAKNIIYESNFNFIKGIKDSIKFQEIIEKDDCYICDAIISQAINKDLRTILKKIEPLLTKFGVEYQIIKNSNQTKYITKENKEYKTIEKIIRNTFVNVYVSSAIKEDNINNLIDNLSCCTLSFSPVYYSHNAKMNYAKGNEYVSCGSLVLAIEFYNKVFDEYIRRNKCFVESVIEK